MILKSFININYYYYYYNLCLTSSSSAVPNQNPMQTPPRPVNNNNAENVSPPPPGAPARRRRDAVPGGNGVGNGVGNGGGAYQALNFGAPNEHDDAQNNAANEVIANAGAWIPAPVAVPGPGALIPALVAVPGSGAYMGEWMLAPVAGQGAHAGHVESDEDPDSSDPEMDLSVDEDLSYRVRRIDI